MPDNEIIPIDLILPAKIPIIPLMGKPIFPGIFTPIMVGNGDDVGTVDEAMQADGIVGLVHDQERVRETHLPATCTRSARLPRSSSGSTCRTVGQHLHFHPQAFHVKKSSHEAAAPSWRRWST